MENEYYCKFNTMASDFKMATSFHWSNIFLFETAYDKVTNIRMKTEEKENVNLLLDLKCQDYEGEWYWGPPASFMEQDSLLSPSSHQ